MEKYGYLRQEKKPELCVNLSSFDVITILTTFVSEDNALGCRDELFCFSMVHAKALKIK